MAKTNKPYVVELDRKRYIGFPHEDSWKLYEVRAVTGESEGMVTYREPKVLGHAYFVKL